MGEPRGVRRLITQFQDCHYPTPVGRPNESGARQRCALSLSPATIFFAPGSLRSFRAHLHIYIREYTEARERSRDAAAGEFQKC